MIKKKVYETPEAELLFVRFEENILSGEWDSSINPGSTWSPDDPDGYGME